MVLCILAHPAPLFTLGPLLVWIIKKPNCKWPLLKMAKNEHKYVLVETCISQPCNDGELPEYTKTRCYLFSYCHLKLMLFDALFFSQEGVFVTLFSWHHSKQNILTTNCNQLMNLTKAFSNWSYTRWNNKTKVSPKYPVVRAEEDLKELEGVNLIFLNIGEHNL